MKKLDNQVVKQVPTFIEFTEISESLAVLFNAIPIVRAEAMFEESKQIAKKIYNTDTVKVDAFRHIFASILFTQYVGGTATELLGEVNEFVGALRNYLLGGNFDSGWKMDEANNKIGIALALINLKTDKEAIITKVKAIIDAGEFHS